MRESVTIDDAARGSRTPWSTSAERIPMFTYSDPDLYRLELERLLANEDFCEVGLPQKRRSA